MNFLKQFLVDTMLLYKLLFKQIQQNFNIEWKKTLDREATFIQTLSRKEKKGFCQKGFLHSILIRRDAHRQSASRQSHFEIRRRLRCRDQRSSPRVIDTRSLPELP